MKIVQKKVAIIGPAGAPGVAQAYDETWELWGLNSSYRQHPGGRFAKMFNLHRYQHLERDCPEYVDWDATASRRAPGLEFVVIDHWGGLLKNEVIFPAEELYKIGRGRYHASSFDWMVAYAIYLGAAQIHLHGANFALDSPRLEPISARACLEYWLGFAEGNGIKTGVGLDCHGLFRQFHLVMSESIYGVDDVAMVEDRVDYNVQIDQ